MGALPNGSIGQGSSEKNQMGSYNIRGGLQGIDLHKLVDRLVLRSAG
jgi:hypothetical protein